MRTCQLTIFAADHGLAAEGVSAYPQAVTRQMLAELPRRQRRRQRLRPRRSARAAGRRRRGRRAIRSPTRTSSRAASAPGTRNALREPAMTAAERDAGARGRPGARRRRRLGRGLLRRDGHRQHLRRRRSSRTRSPGCRSTRSSGAAPASTTPGSRASAAILARAAARTPPALPAPDALAEYGGFEIAMMAGAMLGAAAAGRVVIVDGFIAGAAALVASARAPAARGALVFAHRSAEHGHAALLGAPRRRAAARPRHAARRGHRRAARLAAGPRRRGDADRDGELRERRGQRPGMSGRVRDEAAAGFCWPGSS